MSSQGLFLIVVSSFLFPARAGAIIPFFNEFKMGMETLGGIHDSITGGHDAASQIIDASQELGNELGLGSRDESEQDPVGKEIEIKIEEVKSTYREAGYTDEEVDHTLSVIASDQTSIAKKLRSLRSTIKSLKGITGSVGKLIGALSSVGGGGSKKEGVLTEKQISISVNQLHQEVLNNQMIVNRQLDEHLKTARAEKSYKKTLTDHYEKTFKRIKEEENIKAAGKKHDRRVKEDEIITIAWAALGVLICVAALCIITFYVKVGLNLLKISIIAGMMIEFVAKNWELLPKLGGLVQ